jgi:hypothetical protein
LRRSEALRDENYVVYPLPLRMVQAFLFVHRGSPFRVLWRLTLRSFRDGIRYLSNLHCHPGRAGESPYELAAGNPAQHLHRQKERIARVNPAGKIQRDTSRWDDIVNMRRREQVLTASMENAEDANGGGEGLGIGRDCQQRGGAQFRRVVLVSSEQLVPAAPLWEDFACPAQATTARSKPGSSEVIRLIPFLPILAPLQAVGVASLRLFLGLHFPQPRPVVQQSEDFLTGGSRTPSHFRKQPYPYQRIMDQPVVRQRTFR